MQPSQRLKGSLVSVLARHGDMEAALKVCTTSCCRYERAFECSSRAGEFDRSVGDAESFFVLFLALPT